MTPNQFRDHIAQACGFPSILESMEQERREYWKNMEGKCQGCNAHIAIEDQYCDACEAFLIQSMEENK